MLRSRTALAGALAAACVSLAPTSSAATPAAAPRAPSTVGWLWLSSWLSAPCTYTAKVEWAGYGHKAKTLEVFVTEGYSGPPLVPAFKRVKAAAGTATVTLAPLASSTTENHFYVWAQLLNRKGAVIPGSVDFASDSTAYCTAPA